MRRLTLLPVVAMLASACSDSPAEPPPPPDAAGYVEGASGFVDLGHRPPTTASAMRSEAPSAKPTTNAVANGGFESNAGPGSTDFADWGTYNEGSGAVFAQSGTESPLSGFGVPAPPEGEFAAMTDQFGPGLHIVYQDVTVPEGATLGFDLYLGNRAGDFADPPSLSPDVFPNQQFRADVMDPAATIDDVGSGVLAKVYQTVPGDAPESGYSRVVYDLSAFAGQTIRIRFAQVDNLGNFQAGIDDVVVGREPKGGEPGGPAAYVMTGSGHVGEGADRRTFSFSARKAADGAASGSFQLFSREAGARVHGVVTCATVFGRTAWIGGRITTKGPFEGREAIFRAADLGAGTKGDPDRLSLLQLRGEGDAARFCNDAPPFPGLDLTPQGNISVSSPGERSFTEFGSEDFVDVGVWIPCALDGAGELVVLNGRQQTVLHITEDQAGGFSVHFSIVPQGVSGVGQSSGDRYRMTGGVSSSRHSTISGVPGNGTFVDNFRIVGPGPGNDYILRQTGHFTVNANGDVTVDRYEFSADCR